MRTAAVVIIGNEILSGKFADENGPYFIERLRSLGVRLGRLVTISDVRAEIGEEVRLCSERFDLVITTGGVGPTHDDVTMEGIALGFGVPVESSPVLSAILDRYDLIDDANRRMAMVPQGAVLIEHPSLFYPAVQFRNVIVLPGVPKLVRQKFEAIADRFAGPGVHCARVHAADRESAVAGMLTDIDARHPEVEIGSYPRFGDEPFNLIVTLESVDTAALDRAVRDVRSALQVVEPEADDGK